MKFEYLSLIISFIAALAWIPSLIQVLKRPKYKFMARFKDCFKIQHWEEEIREGEGKVDGFLLIILLDIHLFEPENGIFDALDLDVEVRFKGEDFYHNGHYVSDLSYYQNGGFSGGRQIEMRLEYPPETNIHENKKIIPLFIEGDTTKYNCCYDDIDDIRVTLRDGKKNLHPVSVEFESEDKRYGDYICKCMKPKTSEDEMLLFASNHSFAQKYLSLHRDDGQRS